MNTVWSQHIQGVNTLYCSRKLRFDDLFCEQYTKLFSLDPSRPLRILEIGCGPGALAGALLRWYPNAVITAIDRDSAFIDFAREQEKGITFLEGDATALPFADNTFDVTISNTVAEHIEPERFYGEQLRVLKPGGICLVLSARRGITVGADCLKDTPLEEDFWKKAAELDHTTEQYEVCKYPMTEAEIPLTMEKYGFRSVSTGYVTVDLTPDDPSISKEKAYQMIHANRANDLEAVQKVANTLSAHFTQNEIETMRRLINEKYDVRLRQYDNGEKQWDTNVSVTMIVRGTK